LRSRGEESLLLLFCVVVVVSSSQVLCLFSAAMKSLSEEGLCILLFLFVQKDLVSWCFVAGF
jgi:hypothetical protein